VTLSSNSFFGNTTHNTSDTWEFLSNGDNVYKTGLHFVSEDATITSTSNIFKYFLYNEFGGAIFVDSATFNDDGSTYQENTAI
jgi:hypothetical protein